MSVELKFDSVSHSFPNQVLFDYFHTVQRIRFQSRLIFFVRCFQYKSVQADDIMVQSERIICNYSGVSLLGTGESPHVEQTVPPNALQ